MWKKPWENAEKESRITLAFCTIIRIFASSFPHKSVAIEQLFPHKNVVIEQLFPHKSVAIEQLFPHKRHIHDEAGRAEQRKSKIHAHRRSHRLQQPRPW